MPSSCVAAALSGGVDSAVAALLLLEQGHNVIGVTMRLWNERDDGGAPAWDPTDGARQVAEELGISFHVVDAVLPFRRLVVERFISEYAAGHTPNPCLYCNRHIKFGLLREHALNLGANRLATGHYARIRVGDDGQTLRLLKGVDERKDQSYFLYTLGQLELSQAVFPLGEWTKDRVRALARERGLPVARTEESQDLCFVLDNDYRRFLRIYAPQAFRKGPIVDREGEVLGEHRGLTEYTVGQRSGIGVPGPEALYVLRLDVERNALVVGPKSQLGRCRLDAEEVHWVSGQPPQVPVDAEIKIRYRARLARGRVTPLHSARAQVRLYTPLRDITPGQGVVFYQGDVVLGGGLIANESRGAKCHQFPLP